MMRSKVTFFMISFSAFLLAGATSLVHAQQIIAVEGDVEFTHDPSIEKDGNTWYLFGTASGTVRKGELPVRCSEDLHHWRLCGYVFDQIPGWIKKESPATKELWAPDVSFFHGEYYLYYAFSIFGKNTSGIALATNKTLNPASPDFKWIDHGLVVQSKAEDDFNCIDPNLIIDGKGQPWLAFGSFWSGIKMRSIDPKTGLLSSSDSKLYSIASRVSPSSPAPNQPNLPGDWQAIEAPFIIHHGGFYYLFVSFDLCCRGAKSNYKTMVGRAKDVTGPFVDGSGVPMMKGGGTPLLLGNERWAGPGGESVFQEKDRNLIVYHAYDNKTGHPFLQISTLSWVDGWPKAILEGGSPAGK